MTRRHRRDESGFFTIWTLGLCMCLFAVGGVSLDLWRTYTDRRQVASMTDAAAIAAASQIDLVAFRATPSVIKLDPAGARERAATYLQTEAAANGTELTDVQIDVDENSVVVVTKAKVRLSLTQFLAPGRDMEIQVTSAAEPREEQ